jgi:hypothetical protein
VVPRRQHGILEAALHSSFCPLARVEFLRIPGSCHIGVFGMVDVIAK